MRLIRRLVHIVSWVGTLAVALLALALIVSQTPWFRDWLRRAIIRESRQYLDGELAIGRVTGNLLFGIGLADVTVGVSGDRVIAVRAIDADYSVFRLLSGGLVVDRITLTEPRVHAVRDARGWNLGRLVRKREQEADRRGPGRPVSLPSIAVENGSVRVDDGRPSSTYRLPKRIDDVDLQAAFRYEPVHFTIELANLSFRGTDPDLTLQQMAGGIAVRDDNLYMEKVAFRTGESTAGVSGVIESYLQTPVIKLAADGSVSLPELGRFIPVLSGYAIHPKLGVKATGPASRLVMDLDIQSEAGTLRGPLTADLVAPDFAFSGPLRFERLNIGPVLKAPSRKSDVTGDVRIDLTLPSAPPHVPPLERLRGTFAFNGSRAIAFGYDAAGVQASGAFRGPAITLASASAHAYGARATTSGTIVLPQGRRPITYDLQGTATNVDLRRLPPAARAPKLDTALAVTAYHVTGRGTAARGSATLDRSAVEGATIAAGTVVEFDTASAPVAYAANGAIDGLDVSRLGRALEIEALDDARYQGQVSGSFDLRAAGTKVEDLRLDASGRLTDSTMWGAHVPSMAFGTRIAGGALTVNARGPFDRVNPSIMTGRKSLEGNVNGSVDATFRVADLSAPLSPASVAVEGGIRLGPSLIGSVQIAGADIEGRYADEIADLASAHVDGPDVTLDASGRLALGRTSASDLAYRVEAGDMTELGRIAGYRGLEGTVVLDGTITGNGGLLETRGTLNGNGLAYGTHKALDLDSRYVVAVPDFDVVNARMEATSVASVVEVAGVAIDQVEATTTYDQKRLAFEAAVQERGRTVAAAGNVVFHPDHQELHLQELTLATGGIEWQNVPGTEAAIQYRQGEISIKDLRLARGDQSLDVAGTLAYKLNGATPAGALDVRAVNVDLAEIERLILQPRGFVGRLTADARLTGNLDAPVVGGRVQVAGGGFQNYRYEALTATFDYSGHRLDLDATLQQSPGESVTAKGKVPTTLLERVSGDHVAATPEDTIDLRIQAASLGLGIVQGFTTAVAQVGGTLEADVRLTGSGRDPHLEGFLDIRNGAFSVPRFGTSYSGLDTRIDLEPDLVRVRRFEILDENGEQLAVQGQLAVHERQVGAVDFTLESQNFEIIDNELGDIGVGANLKVTGQLTRPTVAGDVRVSSGRLELDRILQLFYDPYRVEALPEVVSAGQTADSAGGAREATAQALARASKGAAPAAAAAPAAGAAPASAFDPVTLDIHVRIPDNLVVRGRKLRPGGPTRASLGNLNVTLGGDLDVRKAAGGPVTLAGTINTVRGTYQFQSRQFDIARNGTMRFTGEPKLNPVLDITATRNIPDTGVEAKVRMTGSLEKPELALSSTPPLEESDVLALIVFNRPINELGTGERASLAATAGGIATGFIATPLGDSIGRALDLDIFEIAPTSEGDTLGAGITIGEQVGERTFLKLRQQFGDRTYSEFMLEYQIADFLRLAGSVAPETSNAANRIGQRRIERAGIDLIFFFSY